jgi:V/A-type H+-transporting ATPase subunit F
VKIAVIGPEEYIAPFKAFGVEILPADTAGDAKVQVEKLNLDEYAVILMVEDIVKELPEVVEHIAQLPGTSLAVIPEFGGVTSFIRQRMRKIAARAAGTDILEDAKGTVYEER